MKTNEKMKIFSFHLVVLIEIYFSVVLVNGFNVSNLFCFFANDECPNENIEFWLYSNATQKNPLPLNLLNLTEDLFPERLPLKILIHGFTLNRDLSPNEEVRPVLLQHERVYVISLDYWPLARSICYYPWAVRNARVVAKCLALLINNLIDQGLYKREDIHIIGFSLGAQIAALTANHVNQKLKRITGLDPAGIAFNTDDLKEKLDSSDADFVDVIHTDTIFFSTSAPMGHADFYPNFQDYAQPGCNILEEFRNCNHYRANAYYAESINTDIGFWSYNCDSHFEFTTGQCTSYSHMPHVQMGYHLNESASGSYFLRTNSKPPFAMGPMIEVELEVADKLDIGNNLR